MSSYGCDLTGRRLPSAAGPVRDFHGAPGRLSVTNSPDRWARRGWPLGCGRQSRRKAICRAANGPPSPVQYVGPDHSRAGEWIGRATSYPERYDDVKCYTRWQGPGGYNGWASGRRNRVLSADGSPGLCPEWANLPLAFLAHQQQCRWYWRLGIRIRVITGGTLEPGFRFTFLADGRSIGEFRGRVWSVRA